MTVASVRTPAQAPAPVTWRFRLSDLRVSSAQRLAALEVLDSGWLSMGPRTAAFEQSFAAAAGVEHAVAVANGTAALLLASSVSSEPSPSSPTSPRSTGRCSIRMTSCGQSLRGRAP
jgi:hypothetical protein